MKATKKINHSLKTNPSLNLYKRIAVSFVVLTAVLLLFVVFLSTVRAVIRIVPKGETVSADFSADVVSSPQTQWEITGQIKMAEVEVSKEFLVAGDGAQEVPAKAGGTVIITNTSSSPQPLVATTRLLTPNGVLFRIDKGVTVPAKGQVEAIAHADVAGRDGEIEPTSFTIPGLNETRQKEVYAQSKEKMTGGFEFKRVITEADVKTALDSLLNDALLKAKPQLATEVSGENMSGEAFYKEITSYEMDKDIGEETGKFTIDAQVRIVGVYFNKENLTRLAEAKLYESLPRGREILSVKKDEISALVEKYDLEQGLANLKVHIEGVSIVSPSNDLLKKERLIGLTPDAIAKQLIDAGVAVEVKIDFFPFWIKTLPALKDYIQIKIEGLR